VTPQKYSRYKSAQENILTQLQNRKFLNRASSLHRPLTSTCFASNKGSHIRTKVAKFPPSHHWKTLNRRKRQALFPLLFKCAQPSSTQNLSQKHAATPNAIYFAGVKFYLRTTPSAYNFNTRSLCQSQNIILCEGMVFVKHAYSSQSFPAAQKHTFLIIYLGLIFSVSCSSELRFSLRALIF